ncbi:phage tail protein [Providencia manganoxydans]|uniref:phage tail-collar fiber domain-containing protein n=1 Tax=Providencia manganoxydans TaxID=2923283 RepID=UPI0034E4F228
MKYYGLLTSYGEKVFAEAAALGTKIELTHMAVGDGGGSLPTPDTKQTKLVNEKRRGAINTLFVDPLNANQIIAEQIIPENEGGWWVREMGLFDKSGFLVAISNCPETYKPQLAEGSGRTQTIRMVLITSHTESVTLKIDPSVVLATREFVDSSVKKGIEEHEKSRKHPDASTTAKGLVQLADTLSADNTKAITPKLATEINQRATNAQTTATTANTNATNANNNANSRVPSTRKVNNKPLSTDINLTAGDVDAYTKEESNKNFQPKGEYLPTGYSYSKTESDNKYATKTALNNGLASKLDKTGGELTGRLSVKESLEIKDSPWPGMTLTLPDGDYVRIEAGRGSDLTYFMYRDKDKQLINQLVMKKETGTILSSAQIFKPVGWVGYDGLMQYGRMEARSARAGANVNIADDFPVGVTAGITTIKDYGVGSSDAEYGALLTARGWQDPTGASAQGQLLITNVSIYGRTAYKNVDNKSQFYGAWSAYTTKNTTTDRNGNVKVSGAADHLSDCRVGIPLPWPQTTAPTGYLICNGQTFNKTTYPLLALAYPSGVLPDLRGEFIRGLDAGRNIDSGRAVLSAQGDAIRNITGEMYEANDRMTKFTGALYDGGFVGGNSGLGGGNAGHKIRFDASRVVPTANENRPRNIAFLYIVRAA